MDEVIVEWLQDDMVLTVSSAGLSLNSLLLASQVKRGTLGAELIERTWAALFGYRRDLREEYQRFFRLDYPSFGSFLFLKLDVPLPVVKHIMNADLNKTVVGLSAAYLGGGGGLAEWLKTDEGWGVLTKLINARRVEDDESQD